MISAFFYLFGCCSRLAIKIFFLFHLFGSCPCGTQKTTLPMFISVPAYWIHNILSPFKLSIMLSHFTCLVISSEISMPTFPIFVISLFLIHLYAFIFISSDNFVSVSAALWVWLLADRFKAADYLISFFHHLVTAFSTLMGFKCNIYMI